MKRYSTLVLLPALSLAMLAGCHDSQKNAPLPITKNSEPVSAVVPATMPEPVAAPPAVEAVVIEIDNSDLVGFHAEGTWNPASGGNDKKDDVVWAEKDTVASSTATWTPAIKVAGNYAVYEWHGEDPNSDHATNAPFTIKYDGGTKSIPVNLRENTGKWNLLGTFKFAIGSSGNVTVTNLADGNVLADAVRFVPMLDLKKTGQ